ncbi:FapA family protein [Enterovibrio sp. ZSDZ35]|uniref:FapA family protein n=1 Tax=Enterovibrio qingdaonensis TaxID=2899818 RepID=A0ABT5QJP1_9GAMM|nr:FapA family protein [Enterovibrio sp. ZSDZ35]MDD1781208.1 FapA family protein [Enterovibrio sp. ZSDZ35]
MLQQLLRLSNDGRRVYMSVVPKADENAPHVQKKHIVEWLTKHNVANFFRFEETIENVLVKINASNDDWKGEPDDVVVAERRDALVSARLDEQKMTAFLRVDGACGGNPIKGNDLLGALKKSQIVRGVKKQTLQKLLTASSRLKPGEYLEVPIAAGKWPVSGDDSKIAYLVQDSKTRVLRPQEREDGTVDMRDLGKMITVQEGQPLAKRIPPTKGIEGFKVTGEIITTPPGKDVPLRLFPGSAFSSNDENVIIALTSGMPILHPDGVEVDNALCMKAVTVATGHVNFEGSVVINGDVAAGMKVQATGSITVGGVVESAVLEAGGDIVIHNGILGRQVQSDQEINTQIRAKGSVIAKFAQYAKIVADGDIAISQHAMHCYTQTGSDLIICDQSKRSGTLTGGNHIARCGIQVVNLGAASGVHTRIAAFTGLSEIIDKTLGITKELEHEHEQLMKVKDAEMKLLQQPANKRPDELIERLAWTKTHHFERIAALKAKMDSSSSELSSLYRSHCIEVFKGCFGGVHCQIGDTQLAVNNEYGPCKFVTNGKEIQIEKLK